MAKQQRSSKGKWTTWQFLLIVLCALLAGVAIGMFVGGSPDGATDMFGRSPGDPHYGHPHP